MPVVAGAFVLLSGCSVIDTIIDTPSNAQSEPEVVVVTDEASAAATATPLLATTPESGDEAQEQQDVQASQSPEPEDELISTTTGRPLPEGSVYRPVLVVMDNAAQARPQTSLMLADIVYEFPLDRADHNTRYLALFADTLPVRVGPVCSSRAYLAETALEWGGLYVSLGDPEIPSEGYPLLSQSGIRSHTENSGDASEFFYTDETISSLKEHTTFFKLLPYVEQYDGFATQASQERFVFQHGIEYEKGKPFQTVGIPFTSSDSERVMFTYDKAKNVLIRSDKNSKKVLGESKSITPTDDVLGYVNETITVQNLIVQFVHVSAYDSNYRSITLTGKGDCMYFVNGRAIWGSWSRPTLEDKTTYLLYDGTPLILEPGNTWIMMMPRTREIKTRYGK